MIETKQIKIRKTIRKVLLIPHNRSLHTTQEYLKSHKTALSVELNQMGKKS